ncbi:hypothetical protein [Methylibium rhizosphaerae]|uniref:hypothetical protein n=1 Tax=Methylibium rhizosphaerae TaxID=2570323 RepID=UPI00112DF4B1|nr:hypothetical protein [Methylibium rhizosphaerae]
MGRRASPDVLAAALRDVHRLLASLAMPQSLADDPLRLALPPLPSPTATAPQREVLTAYAALYLQAELEEAGVLPTVDALTEQRHALALRERPAAEKLDRLARTARDYPTRSERAAVFARLFGLGTAAVRHLQGAANQGPFGGWGSEDGTRLDFQQRLLRFATAVVRADLERQRGARPSTGSQAGPISQAAWRAAAQELLALVATAPAGSLVQWARRLHARILQAFELLGDEGLMRQLGSRSAWDSLAKLLPEDGAPRRDAAARRGAAGQQLLRSLADAFDAELPDAESVQAALRWLIASGLPVPDNLPQFRNIGPTRLPDTAFAASSAAIARARRRA